MAYVSLYRKYRPQTFSDVIGQSHVLQTLSNAIEEDRVHHAYLFTGPRGTGKTSTARIMAKAVNCENGPTPNPCNTCQQCVAITDGSSVDVLELDMASHGGVDDARELRERALFAPASARKKVYILDEVHMASPAAFNALLKLIEEPPAHVLFTMATTDPQKVLPTIMSRVQRLDLRRVGAADVGEHVRTLAGLEGYSLDDAAVDAVVRSGDGSVRDTLSVLEQVLAYGDAAITGEQVASLLGHTPVERTLDAIERVANRDVAGVMSLVQSLLDEGHDLRRFTIDLAQHVRDLLVLQVAPDRPDLVDATDDHRERLMAQTSVMARESLLHALGLISETLVEMRQSAPRLPLELTLAKLAMPQTSTDVGALADRIARLETGTPTPTAPAPAAVTPAPAPTPTPPAPAPAPEPVVQPRPVLAASAPTPEPEPAVTPEPEPAPQPVAAVAPEPAPEPAPAPPPPVEEPPAAAEPAPAPTPPAAPSGELTVDQVASAWPAIIDVLKRESMRIGSIVAEGRPHDLTADKLTLAFQPRHEAFHAKQVTSTEYATAISAAVERALGTSVTIASIILQTGGAAPASSGTPQPVQSAAANEDEAAVAEAEYTAATSAPVDSDTASRTVTELIVSELDAAPID